MGPGHWELFPSDFDLAAADLGSNALRMNIEWSRVFPASTIGVEGYEALRAAADPAALAHYHAVFAALRERGLVPHVTLNHYTLPVWIHDAVGCHLDLRACSPRGWLDAETTVREIAKFAGFAAREFGGEVDLWTTENEPLSALFPAYLMPTPGRTNPPALLLRSVEFKMAMAAMIEAHARMVDAIRAGDTIDADGDGVAARVGLVYNLTPVYPKDPANEVDQRAAVNVFHLWNLAFLDAVTLGLFDENLDGNAEFRDDLAGRMDFLGINYYGRMVVTGTKRPFLPRLSPLSTFNPITAAYNQVYPRGIYEMTIVAQERYGIPLIITENNVGCDQTNGGANEVRFLIEHLTWLWRAIQEGIDVRGYFYWTLMDNYEWNHGMNSRCGLYAVDSADPAKTRTPRDIVSVFRAVTASGGIPPDLAARFPVDPDPQSE